MSTSYYRTFLVPTWVLLEKTTKAKNDAIMKWFIKREARPRAWLTTGFYKTLTSFKDQGWRHIFVPPKGYDVVVPQQLLAMAVNKHLTEVVGVANPSLDYAGILNRLSTLNRTIKEKEDANRLFNQVMVLQEPVIVSQTFQVAEICYPEFGKRSLLWITEAPFDRSVVTKIAEKVLTIGDGTGFDIDVSKATSKNVDDLLGDKFASFSR